MTNTLFWVSYFGLWVLTLALFAAVFFLYRFHGQMFIHSAEGRATQGPAVDHSLPTLSVKELDGTDLVLGGLPDRKQLIYLASVKCDPCARALPALNAFAQAHKHQVQTVVVCLGDHAQTTNFTKVLSSNVKIVPDPKWEVGTKLRVTTTPFALITDDEAVVRGKGMPDNREGFEWFFNQVIALEDHQSTVETVALSQVSTSV